MTLHKLDGEPIVIAEPNPRTKTDRRIALIRENPHAPQTIIDYARLAFDQAEGRRFVRDYSCARCGVDVITQSGHGPVFLERGSYGYSGATPVRFVCGLCNHVEFMDEAFERKYGASEAHLDGAGFPKLGLSDFNTVRYADKVTLNLTFMDAIKSHKLSAYYASTDFSALIIRTYGEDFALAALDHESFDDSWFVTVPVDSKLRPFRRWNSAQLLATDKAAIEQAAYERRQATIRAIDAELATERNRRLSEL